MVVARYILKGLPISLPAGLEKSRAEVRRPRGSVDTGAGATGRVEACLSWVAAPAWVVGGDISPRVPLNKATQQFIRGRANYPSPPFPPDPARKIAES